jgi:hypothetical protein
MSAVAGWAEHRWRRAAEAMQKHLARIPHLEGRCREQDAALETARSAMALLEDKLQAEIIAKQTVGFFTPQKPIYSVLSLSLIVWCENRMRRQGGYATVPCFKSNADTGYVRCHFTCGGRLLQNSV